MNVSLRPLLVLLPILGGVLLAGCGEDKPDPVTSEAQQKQRGPTRPGGAPPGFPVAGQTGTTGTAPGVPAGATSGSTPGTR